MNLQPLINSMSDLTGAMDRASRAMREMGNATEHWRREFEAGLSQREWIRYMKLMDEHEHCWLDCAVIIERARIH